MGTLSLFRTPTEETLSEGAVLLRGFALSKDEAVLRAVAKVCDAAPFRHMKTPSGLAMSVAMTNCGAVGWVSGPAGYRYTPLDPSNEQPWPPMPDALLALAHEAAKAAGFSAFRPDACLVNRYAPGARMGLHQDKDERDFTQPIVSVSLGLPATFLWGGATRADRPLRTALAHGDVVVFGGPSRLRFHGVAPLKDGTHPAFGAARINLTFRVAR